MTTQPKVKTRARPVFLAILEGDNLAYGQGDTEKRAFDDALGNFNTRHEWDPNGDCEINVYRVPPRKFAACKGDPEAEAHCALEHGNLVAWKSCRAVE